MVINTLKTEKDEDISKAKEMIINHEFNRLRIHEFFHHIIGRIFSCYSFIYILIMINEKDDENCYPFKASGHIIRFENLRTIFQLLLKIVCLTFYFIDFLVDFIDHLFHNEFDSIRNSLIGSRNHFILKFKRLTESEYNESNDIELIKEFKKFWSRHINVYKKLIHLNNKSIKVEIYNALKKHHQEEYKLFTTKDSIISIYGDKTKKKIIVKNDKN
jgi:hypothetical protein